jgi:RNA polymerase sigma-70 factor (ECF subfamily)
VSPGFISISDAVSKVVAATSQFAQFPTTQWTRVIAAGDRAAPEARSALAQLCDAYWYPIYAFIRRKGHSPNEACDLTQDYFTRLLEKPVIAAADPSRGRFRAFLKTDCHHFLLDKGRRKRVRAAVLKAVPIDAGDAETRYGFEPADDMTPDRLFDRTWAVALLDRVLGLLAEEYAATGRADVFDRLKVILSQGKEAVPVAELAAQLGMKKGKETGTRTVLRGRKPGCGEGNQVAHSFACRSCTNLANWAGRGLAYLTRPSLRAHGVLYCRSSCRRNAAGEESSK